MESKNIELITKMVIDAINQSEEKGNGFQQRNKLFQDSFLLYGSDFYVSMRIALLYVQGRIVARFEKIATIDIFFTKNTRRSFLFGYFHMLHIFNTFIVTILLYFAPQKTLDSHQLLLLRRKLRLRDHPGIKQLFVLLDLLDGVGCLSWSGLWY